MLKTATELIVESWKLYAKNWRKFLPYLIMLFLPTLILSALGAISLYLSVYLPSSSLTSNVVILVVFAASLVLTIWVSIALARTMFDCLLARPTEWKETFFASSDLIWPVIYTSFLVTLIVLGGTLLLIIPGIIFAVWYSFTFYTVIFENIKGLNALSASKSMVAGRWLPVAWRLLITALVFGFLNYALSFVFAYLIRLAPAPVFIQSAAASALASLAGAITTPLSIGAILILYQSLKQNPVIQQTPSSSM